VEKLRKQPNLPATANQFLSDKRPYSSAYHVLKLLSIHGADREVIALTQDEAFDVQSLARFAMNWYFRPAAEYAAHGREQDALGLFRTFIAIMRWPVGRGRWLSLKGVDATDVPVLVDLFCTSANSVEEDLCLLGLLKAIAPTPQRRDSLDEPFEGPSLTSGIVGVAKAYAKLPLALQNTRLARYLKLWEEPDVDALQHPPTDFTASQMQAWNYGVGVVLRNWALDRQAEAECRNDIALSKRAFESARAVQSNGSYFVNAINQHLHDFERPDFCYALARQRASSH
jgi:hypothetical protein